MNKNTLATKGLNITKGFTVFCEWYLEDKSDVGERVASYWFHSICLRYLRISFQQQLWTNAQI